MNKLKMIVLGTLLLFSLACVVTIPAPGANPPPVAAPVDSPQPSLTPSRTIEPTDTPFPTPTRRPTMELLSTMLAEQTVTLPASLTPAVAVETVEGGFLATSTLPGAKVGYFSATPQAYKCEVELIEPLFGQDIKPRTDFMAFWRLYNVGSAPWPQGEFVFEYVEGAKLHKLDYEPESLSYAVFPKDKFPFRIRLIAPKAPGRYITTWGLRRTNKPEPFCTFSLTIDVVK